MQARTDVLPIVPQHRGALQRPARLTGRLLLLLVVNSLLLRPALATCDTDWIRISELRENNGVLLQASNQSAVPLTFTLRARNRDVRIDGPAIVTETLKAHESLDLMQIEFDNPEQSQPLRYSCEWTVGDKDANHDHEQLYLFPYEEGQSYRILQGYGSRFSHTGYERYAVDFKMAEGTPVHAARDGVVARIEESNDIGCWEDGCGKYANYIVILHDDGTTGEYYHLQKNGALVEQGQQVTAGERIGLSGNTGHTTTPHLHFAVYRPVEWGRTQSIAVRFASADGIVDQPRRGEQFAATSADTLRDTNKGTAGR